ncbi:CheC, inhibitor of MCP methylation [Syntrophobotulus glycolicus DSM 8271]|uniref:CheC, inhibitor of MCP methylation n=1 Tax=Syntrophobotulus glycolicus (strain DSM 8271 / FlGlyR) TaxID=645991 RepID=F0SZG1_SYNGF|nr:flagellar motor switch phosphatase FliY [Syntrophobotulus glycolicus]ADY54966.1 CheC, inhibitor of MCP methylation [Syntrophobotulus glycolicus DSM 8271]
MGSEMLSQEEINALLSGPADDMEQEEITQKFLEEISSLERDALGEIANISMGTAATTLSQLVGRKVEITTPKVDITTPREVLDEYPVPYVLIAVSYKKGITGSNMLILSRSDGSIIVDLMMGGSGQSPYEELTDLQVSGISEAMNQMMGSAATSMSTMFSSTVDITPPNVIITKEGEEDAFLQTDIDPNEPVVKISFKMNIEGVLDSTLLQVIPLSVAKNMTERLLNNQPEPQSGPEARQEREYHSEPPLSPPPDIFWQQQSSMSSQSTPVQPAQFSQLVTGNHPAIPNNLDLIFDVPLQVSVELGKANKTIKDILELGPGSVVELDRIAGEPVDMIVNGKLIAKCEVVVINETFGIRITEIINQAQRMETLK